MATVNQDTGVAMFTFPSSSLSSKYGRVWLQKKQDGDGYNAKLEVPKIAVHKPIQDTNY